MVAFLSDMFLDMCFPFDVTFGFLYEISKVKNCEEKNKKGTSSMLRQICDAKV